MTPEQIELVQVSFSRVVPIADAAADLFYRRLFEIAPEVRPLFRSDMTEQGRKLMATLAIVVGGLKSLDGVLPAAKVLAIRHVEYGVEPEHYAPVGAALIWALERGLADDFTPVTREAWRAAFAVLSGAMIKEAYGDGA